MECYRPQQWAEIGMAWGWPRSWWSCCLGECFFSPWMKRAEGSACCLVGTIWIYSLEGWKLERTWEILLKLLLVGIPSEWCLLWLQGAGFPWRLVRGVILRWSLIGLWKELHDKSAIPRTWKSFDMSPCIANLLISPTGIKEIRSLFIYTVFIQIQCSGAASLHLWDQEGSFFFLDA